MLDKIHELEEKDLLDSDHASIQIDNRFHEKDIEVLINALKEARIY